MTDDRQTPVDELRQLVRTFVAERKWESFHNPKNLAMSLSIEASELMEHFQWLSLDEARQRASDPQHREAIADEVADCLAYVLAMADAVGIDLTTELQRKMIKNAVKYPVEPLDPSAD